jgi:hypothetical protein
MPAPRGAGAVTSPRAADVTAHWSTELAISGGSKADPAIVPGGPGTGSARWVARWTTSRPGPGLPKSARATDRPRATMAAPRPPQWNTPKSHKRTSTLAGTPSSHRMNARPMDPTSLRGATANFVPRRAFPEHGVVIGRVDRSPAPGGSRRRFPARLDRGSSARASRLGHAVSTAPPAQSGPETSHDDAASSTRRSVTMSCP